MDEKIEFTHRLRAAMIQAGYAASPSVLEHEFNLRWYGQPISNQAAWGWLNSRSIPKQDKLQVLAEWLQVEPQALRFGAASAQRIQETRSRWETALAGEEREVLQAYLDLPVEQRKIIREVILAFALAGQAANH